MTTTAAQIRFELFLFVAPEHSFENWTELQLLPF